MESKNKRKQDLEQVKKLAKEKKDKELLENIKERQNKNICKDGKN